MKIVSWNVNGIRSVLQKGLKDFISKGNYEIVCFQETKMQMTNEDNFLDYPYFYFSNALKKGYSGTAIYSKIKPLNVTYGIYNEYNDEGRLITLEFDNFYLINCYSPNSKDDLSRIPYRMEFENKLRNYMLDLNKIKPVILCGDLNVAPTEIDLKNPKNNLRSAGFTIEEREKFKELTSTQFVDYFRYLYPDKIIYTWWSYRFQARLKNAGWRIDHFIVSKSLLNNLEDMSILNEIYGSDHCPIILTIK